MPEAYSVMLTLFCFVCILPRIKKDIYFIKILIVFDFVVCYTKSPFKTLIFKVIQRQLNIFKELKPRFVSPPKFGALSSPDTQCALVSLIELGINIFCQL